MRKFLLLKESAAVTILTILLTFFIGFFPFKLKFAEPISQELKDFDIYDLGYASSNLSNFSMDTNIVLVEIGSTRSEIAGQLLLLDSLHPSVIGLDVMFRNFSDDSFGDFYLNEVISQMDNLVVASKIEEDSSGREYNKSSYFSKNLAGNNEGYINFAGEEYYSVIRSFVPFIKLQKVVYSSFASKILEVADSAKFKKLKARNKKYEIINYQGNLEFFANFSRGDLKDDSLRSQISDKIKNKIVLLGFFCNRPPIVLEDLHFTPLNMKAEGKSYPDMYGVVIHANIISMFLDGRYIWFVPKFLSYLIATIFNFVLAMYVLYCYKNKVSYLHLRLVMIRVISIILLIYLFLLLFYYHRIKTPLLPIILSLVLSSESLIIYKFIAKKMNEKWKYKTIFSSRGKKSI